MEDIANTLKDGYDRCLSRLSSAGIDVTGHAFEDYVRDYASSNPENDQAREN